MVLPSVSSCQHYVKMPEYSSYEILKARFELAIEEGSENFTLSWACLDLLVDKDS